MPYILQHFWPEATQEHYEAEVAALHPADGLPEGQIFHAAGPTEGGFLIVTIWDTREHEQTFVNDVLMPAQPVEGGFPKPAVRLEAEAVNLITHLT